MNEPIDPDRCESRPPGAPQVEATPARRTYLGPLEIRRALPLRERRMVGPWCFLDRYGPVMFSEGQPMDLAPHPHIGLQTVSWLIDGEILHRDSLGNESLLRPGGVNLMTAAGGIAHSEQTPLKNSGRLNGAQLWIAMPERSRNGEPGFAFLPELPTVELRGGRVAVILGEVGSAQSPAALFSPLVGADLEIWKNDSMTMPLRRDFEHALLVLDGTPVLEGEVLAPDVLYYLGSGRDEVSISTRSGARLLLIGGTPFGETILMWWNFVARTPEEIVRAAEEWNGGQRFGRVAGHSEPLMPAPPLRGRVRPPGAS
jgi:redox-sensitive bicupin YhaK (pirin superfamily)